MATSVLAPRDVPTTMNYYKPIGDGPPRSYVAPAEGQLQSNVGQDPFPTIVHDVRGRESEYVLDKQGFQFVHWPSAEKDFTDDEVIQNKYYAEVEALLKEVTGAKRVHIFDHTIRWVFHSSITPMSLLTPRPGATLVLTNLIPRTAVPLYESHHYISLSMSML